MICSTETHTNASSLVQIENINPCWKAVHHPTAAHGLAICFNSEIVVVEKEYELASNMEMLPLLLRIDNSLILLVLVYRPPGGPRNEFIDQLSHEIALIDDTRKYRTIVLGDFNSDQMLQENVNAYRPFCEQHSFTQRTQYSTHVQGGILDLVFDNKGTDPTEWLPSPYSDHFVILIGI